MVRIEVNPSVIRWACARSGRSVEDLQKRFPRLMDWERGRVRPTLKQLEALAKATFTPIGFFFFEEPPVDELPVPDFRTMDNAEVRRPSPHLLNTIYLCQQRQAWYQEEAQREKNLFLQNFVGSLETSVAVEAAAEQLGRMFRFDMARRMELRDENETLRQFIEGAEEQGVLVMVSGVVGNNTHQRLDVNEFRGFTLSDPVAPLIFINGADAKAAQIFTLAHEIAHLGLGQSGISNAQAATRSSHSIERWCNQVAAELLVPSNAISEEFDPREALTDEIRRLARFFKVSRLVILRRIHDIEELSRDQFRQAYAEELNRLEKIPNRSGGHYGHSIAARASKRFVRALIASALEERTTLTEAMRLLDVKNVSALKKIAHNLEMRF